MLKSNLARNSRLETHPNEQQGRRPLVGRLFVLDRFPDAFQNLLREVAAKRHPFPFSLPI